MSTESNLPHVDDALGRALRALPAGQPPEDGWQRLRMGLEQQTRLSAGPSVRARIRRSSRAGWSLAATLALAAVLTGLTSLWPAQEQPLSTAATRDLIEQQPVAKTADDDLLAESARLEAQLNWLSASSQSAESLALDLALVDRLQWVDRLLADAAVTPATREVLWQQRVNLLRQRIGLGQRESLLAAQADVPEAMPL